MPSYGLPVNLDSTYADDGADPSVKLHQTFHDQIHGFVNEFDTATRGNRAVFVYDSATSLFVPRGLTSADVPTVSFEVTAGGAYTFTAADAGKLKASPTSDTAAVVWTIPTNATVPFGIGTAIKVLQRGTGQITVSGQPGVVLNATGAAYKTAAQHASLVATKLFADTWLLEGGAV